MDNVISWLNDHDVTEGEGRVGTWIEFSARHGVLKMYFTFKLDQGESEFTGYLLCRNANEWGRLANAFGINQNIRSVSIRFGGGLPEDGIESIGDCQCVRLFFAGLERNESVKYLTLDIVWLPLHWDHIDSPYPTFNIQNAQFKTNLLELELLNKQRLHIMDYQCPYFSTCLEGLMTSEHRTIGDDPHLGIRDLCITDIRDGQQVPLNATIFQSLISACSDAYSLRLYCLSPSHCSAVASFLRDTNTVKLTVEFSDDTLSLEDEATIINGLRENKSLREFHLYMDTVMTNEDVADYFPHGHLAKALCDSSSIENILNSNHTLTKVYPRTILPFDFEDVDVFTVGDCLSLNENTDKDKVKREKIARYYFVGDFDVSPLARLPMSVVPSILGMIKCDKLLDRQSAIFRLLKSIPDLCNVDSTAKIVCNDNHDDIEAGKFGECVNKRRRKS